MLLKMMMMMMMMSNVDGVQMLGYMAFQSRLLVVRG